MSILEPEPERTIAESNFQKLLFLLSHAFTKSQKEHKYEYHNLNRTNIEKNSKNNLNDKVVKEIMTSRKDTFTINIDDDINTILDSIENINYSKIPVYESKIDNIIGILYVTNLLKYIEKNGLENLNIRTILQKPNYIPELKKVDELLMYIKENQDLEQVFILVDEYGGFSGIVTTNDLIYEDKGINYKKYINSSKIRKIDENNYIVKGFLNINDFNKIFNASIEHGDYDTLNGYIINKLGKIPTEDKYIQLDVGNVILKLIKMNNHRIEDVQVSILD